MAHSVCVLPSGLMSPPSPAISPKRPQIPNLYFPNHKELEMEASTKLGTDQDKDSRGNSRIKNSTRPIGRIKFLSPI
jgi:hypothetical protein